MFRERLNLCEMVYKCLKIEINVKEEWLREKNKKRTALRLLNGSPTLVLTQLVVT